ncbi:collagen-like protein [Okibacterium fritillariae]|uniref:Uncharacterized protein n=1 Tax=Okibacterium fritillariae TaxID=123320 RepID=A0A1T5IA24_9MICO|nr:collagen-like protein [Okibacterium fritillariae]SKC35782.1 hypothetical protein SAMN06309945_0110 [Okibacterium fritillariae]
MHTIGASTKLHRAWSPLRLVLASVATLVLVAGASLFSVRAFAVLNDVPETGTPGYLSLRSDPYPAQFLELSPGSPARWQIAADLQDAETARLTLEMRKDGELVDHPRGLEVTVERCDAEWTGLPDAPTCAANPVLVTEATPLDDYSSTSPVFDLDGLTAASGKFLLVTLAVEDSPEAAADESLMNLTGDIGFALTATGDSIGATPTPTPSPSTPATPGPSATPGAPGQPGQPAQPGQGGQPGATGRSPLAATGVDIVALVALGAGAIGLGLVVSSARAAGRRNAAAATTGTPLITDDRGDLR